MSRRASVTPTITLQEHLKALRDADMAATARLDAERDLRYQERSEAQDKAVAVALVAAEKAVQAALLSAERAGLRPVLHVHDEIVCEVPADAADDASALLHAIMLDAPDWAATFPLDASGWVGRRYRK